MTTTTAWISKQGTDSTQARSGIATIDAAETATLAIPCHGRGVVRLQFPGTFTGTTVTFTVQPYRPDDPANKTANPSFTTLYDGAGNAVTKTVGTNRVINVPELSGAYAFTIVSGSTEGSARQIGVSMFGLEPGVPPIDSITANPTPVTAATSNGYGAPVNVIRPANMTPYTANDVVGGAIDLGVMGPNASQVILTSSRLMPEITAVPTGMTSFTLYLYTVTPPSALADNAPFVFGGALGVDLPSYVGKIPLGTPTLDTTGATALIVEQANLGKQLTLAGTHLFAYLVTAGAFTPAANSEVYQVVVKSVAV